MNVYEIVTAKILKKLEEGVIPWQKPWKQGKLNRAVNWKTQKPYRGVNRLWLDAGEYATYLQVQEAGGSVKKGEKGEMVVFWKITEVEEEDLLTGKMQKKSIPMLRYYTVFEINRQCEGLASKQVHSEEAYDNDPIEEAEKIVKGYQNCPLITFEAGRAFYRPSTDSISVPAITEYHKPEEYYSTLFHEMIHSTGHQSRLNRPEINRVVAFGDNSYSKEELVAEIGAAMLCGVAGIDEQTIENSAAYIDGWRRKLSDDPKLIVIAAGAAEKAADHILAVKGDVE